jgi:hypothetical protein
MLNVIMLIVIIQNVVAPFKVHLDEKMTSKV